MALSAAALDLQGHRGARGLAPENTLRAFEVALQHGVTTLELDIAITRDGVLVIHHDLALNPAIARDEQGRWLPQPSAPIHTMTFEELQRHDVGRLQPGHRYSANYPDQVAVDGSRVPRLSDLFDLVSRGGHDQVRFAIETKLDPRRPEATLPPEPFAKAVVDEIRKAGMAGRAQILSFDWRTLQVVQRIAPEIPTVYLSAQRPFLDNIGAGAAGDVLEEQPEAPVLHDGDPLARLDDAHDGRLHPCAAGAGDREGRAVPRPERAAEEVLRVHHQRGERGVELADESCPHRPQDPRVGVGGPRSHEEARGERGVSRHTAGCGLRARWSARADARGSDGARGGAAPSP